VRLLWKLRITSADVITTAEREASLFDLSIPKILVLLVLGLMIFGPEQLPRMASQAGRALRDLRRLADNARADLTDSLGPEFRDFDLNDLNPRALVRKHLFDDLADDENYSWTEPADSGPSVPVRSAVRLDPDEVPPYDAEAT
jgi:sec-independent protein translocase protein TatB